MVEDDNLKKWNESAPRKRIQDFLDALYDLIETTESRGMDFVEIMTSLDALFLEVALRYFVTPSDFKTGLRLLGEHYEKIYKSRNIDKN